MSVKDQNISSSVSYYAWRLCAQIPFIIYCVADGDKDRLSPVCSQDFNVLNPLLCRHLEFLLQAFLLLLNRKVKCWLRGRVSSKPGKAIQTGKRIPKAAGNIHSPKGKQQSQQALGKKTQGMAGIHSVFWILRSSPPSIRNLEHFVPYQKLVSESSDHR